LHLRMAPHLREALRDAARAAGCSLNAFAVQVLAAAAGDAARFRALGEPDSRPALAPTRQTWRVRAARNEFIGVMGIEMGSVARSALLRRIDAEDPGYFLEWHQARQTGREPREPRIMPVA
jgi:hypothetical protein